MRTSDVVARLGPVHAPLAVADALDSLAGRLWAWGSRPDDSDPAARRDAPEPTAAADLPGVSWIAVLRRGADGGGPAADVVLLLREPDPEAARAAVLGLRDAGGRLDPVVLVPAALAGQVVDPRTGRTLAERARLDGVPRGSPG